MIIGEGVQMPKLGVFLVLFFPHPLSLSQRERECCGSLSLRERAGVRAIHCSYPRKFVFLPPLSFPQSPAYSLQGQAFKR